MLLLNAAVGSFVVQGPLNLLFDVATEALVEQVS